MKGDRWSRDVTGGEEEKLSVWRRTQYLMCSSRRVRVEICSPNKLPVLFSEARLEPSSVFLGPGPGEIFFIPLPSEMTDSFIRRRRLHGVELHSQVHVHKHVQYPQTQNQC